MKPIDTELPLADQLAWCMNLFDTIVDGGSWAVPRSGLIFNRDGNMLKLVARMPHDPDMPLTPEQLQDYQQSDYEIIRRRFEAAGIKVADATVKSDR